MWLSDVKLCVQENVQYGVNLDVTSYTNGKRETHNPPGRALPYTVWDFYEVLNLSTLLSFLQFALQLIRDDNNLAFFTLSHRRYILLSCEHS